MKLEIDQEFLEICKKIVLENKTQIEWAQIESSDMFQTKNYNGGFDETEMEFCFSYYNSDGKEFWFQLPLSKITDITKGIKIKLDLVEA